MAFTRNEMSQTKSPFIILNELFKKAFQRETNMTILLMAVGAQEGRSYGMRSIRIKGTLITLEKHDK